MRPAGSNAEFDIIFDDFSSVPENPFPNGLIGSWGVAGLEDGGTMFADDVFTFNLRDPAGIPITQLIDGAFDDEINAFVLLSSDPAAAKLLIESARSTISQAEQAIAQGGFQPGTRSSDALIELARARQLDKQALDAIEAGDTSKAAQFLIDASTAKARAELFLEGHNPQPGPFPDGLGGFDTGDPIFADGFESGDVSAWSLGEPAVIPTNSSNCQPNSTTLCLPGDGRFRATVDWRDFAGST